MIESLIIKNFETHLNTSVKLHKGVNTFVGESDDGKSGIIRAFKWNTKNRPQGDAYRNDQLTKKDKKEFVQVEIAYEQTGVVLRERNDSGKNHYVINGGEPLRALRTDVPQEVKDVTQMKDVNIQGQHPTEQYFLLADKPGQVAKKFNEVAGLTIMDKAISDINSQVRTCNTEIKVAEKEIKIRTKDIKESAWLVGAKLFADKLKKYQADLHKKIHEHNILLSTIKVIEKVNTELLTYDKVEEAKKALNLLIQQKEQNRDKERQQLAISGFIFAMKNVDKDLKSVIDTDKALNALNELKTLKEDIEKNITKGKQIKNSIASIQSKQTEITQIEIELINSQAEYVKIRREKECPTCGRIGI